jgi:hypothetical protein
MPKFTVLKASGAILEIEADHYVDAGHEGTWVDFRARKNGEWHQVHRVKARDVNEIREDSE